MNWINKLERKFGRYAIRNLMYYIIILYVVGFALELINSDFYYQYLCLDAKAILHGQIWRIVTFLIQPPTSSIIFMVFMLYLYYCIGRELEMAWGAFRFNLYFFTGVIFHVLAALITYAVTGQVLYIGTEYLNLSLFFAYAMLYPDERLYLFGIIPIKIKYLAWIDGAYFIWAVLQAFLPAYGGGIFGSWYKANAVAAVVSLLNFLIYFFTSRKGPKGYAKQKKRKHNFTKKMHTAQKEARYENGARHRCAICGKTELDDPELEFRFCSKCNGAYEYCNEHLFTHEHRK
jgi:hypothetical protein